ncbi:MAG: hypothetical protein Q9181_001613 [Wetmoreana brouardii]
MFGLLCATAFVAWSVWYVFDAARGFRRNLKAARESGLEWVAAPQFIGGLLALPLSFILFPIFRRLPTNWTDPWLRLLDPLWAYHELYAPFARYGDNFLVVSPWGVYMANASPSVIHQIATRRTDWVKPIEHYSVVEQFGANVLTTEGSTWRDHRKVSSGSFNERSNAVVWKESIRQAQQMIKSWSRREGNNEEKGMWVHDVYPDAATTSLHIISRSGFGVKLLWPGEELGDGNEVEDGYERFTSHVPMGGHTMTFKESMKTMLKDIIWMGLFTKKWLERLPFKRTRKVWEGYINFNDYLHELLELKKASIAKGLAEKDTSDLMGTGIPCLSSFHMPPRKLNLQHTNRKIFSVPLITATGSRTDGINKQSPPSPNDPILSTTDILGNSFIFLLAGHETTANSITFLLILFALNLPAQRRLQSTLDTLLASQPDNPAEWLYPSLFNTLGNSYLGACINEQLRLIASVTMIPKRCVGPQTLVLDDGKAVRLPGNTFQHFCAPSVHRNPKVWPHASTSLRDLSKDNDLDDFVPERWLLLSPDQQVTWCNNDDGRKQEDEDGAIKGHKKTIDELNDSAMDIGSSTLFNPPPGAFIPFSHGPRACLGRRFAMVELVAVTATLMKDYSVELDTREFAAEQEVRGMREEEKKDVYKKSEHRAWTILEKELGGLLTLQCIGRKIPLRISKRGAENFGDMR